MTDGNEPTLFERIGGSAVVDIMVERFYDNMDSMPEAAGIRAMHHPDLGPVREVLKRYFTEWLGGPPALFQRTRPPAPAHAAHACFHRDCRTGCLAAVHAGGAGRRGQ